MILQYGNPESVGMSAKRIEYLENLTEEWTKTGISPSIIGLVARKGVIVSHRAYGIVAPGAEHGSLLKDTIFPVASITKPVIATCIMTLVDDGLIDLNRAVQRYIPEFSGEDKKDIKVRHLLTHTSGMEDSRIYEHKKAVKESGDFQNPWYDKTIDPWTAEKLYFTCTAPLVREPEKEMSYCNSGFELLGEIVKRVTDKPHHVYARERIFEPLGMKDTYFIVPESLRSRVIRRDSKLPFGEWFSSEDSMNSTSAAGGLFTTPYDLAVFAQMFLNNGKYGEARILSPIAVKEMTRNHTPGIKSIFGKQFFPESSWGLGWNVRSTKYDDSGSYRSARAFGHGGAGGTYFLIDPEYDLIFVYFSVFTFEHENVFLNYKDNFSNCVYSSIEEI